MTRQPRLPATLTALALVTVLIGGCGNQNTTAAAKIDAATQTLDTTDASADAVTPAGYATATMAASDQYLPTDVTQTWTPGKMYRLRADFRVRGLRDVRGLIHAHSPYSHDACDGEPEVAPGQMNLPCFEDFRDAVCKVGHEFVMLTDHPTLFADHEFPDVLLYRPERGDQLIAHDNQPTANRMACPGGAPAALLVGGTEGALIAAGLEGHVTPSIDERHKVYGSDQPDAILKEKARGAVSILMHTEDWTVEQIATLPVDGFEMYNLHANLMKKLGAVGEVVGILLGNTGVAPHPDLVLLALVEQDERYLTKWGSVLAQGVHRVTTMGTDCHRNALPMILADGERVDSYRRMMSWFSNHVMVQPKADGSFDDRDLKAALRAGRLYGAFEAFGFPVGFDFHAETKAVQGGPDASVEMGGEVALTSKPVLRVTVPTIASFDPKMDKPLITVQILRARKDGFDVVATGAETANFVPTQAGAYRVDVRMRPYHLKGLMGDLKTLADKDYVWVMSNAIYVTEK